MIDDERHIYSKKYMDRIRRTGDKAEYLKEKFTKWGKITLVSIAAAGTITGLVFLGNELAGGDDARNLGEFDPSVESIDLEKGANLRNDPHTGNNVAEEISEPMSIPLDGVRVYEDNANGKWYGVPISELQEARPDLDPSKDNDGILWVNGQTASVIDSDNTN